MTTPTGPSSPGTQPSAAPAGERDYVLGTDDEELARLGMQHRVWRPTVLDCWYRAGITAGSRVLDVGAGPGYATLDLAEIVGRQGEVVALERSARFAAAGRAALAARGLDHARYHELDLVSDPLPGAGYDAAWCRWVLCFVADPGQVVAKVAAALRPGGRLISHEYAGYSSWRTLPPRPRHAEFVAEVMASWRASGGEPDVGLVLPGLLAAHGLRLAAARPYVLCLRRGEHAWQWPTWFIRSGVDRLRDLGRVTPEWAAAVRAELAAIEADPGALMLTPLVLELVAEKA